MRGTLSAPVGHDKSFPDHVAESLKSQSFSCRFHDLQCGPDKQVLVGTSNTTVCWPTPRRF